MLIPTSAPRRFIHHSNSSSSKHLPPGVSVACGLGLGMLGFDLPSEVNELTLQFRVDVTLLGKGSAGKGENATR